MSGKGTISHWIETLSRGDASSAESFLSPVFRKHDGMTRGQYLRHELSEFKSRKEGFDVPDAPDVIEAETHDGLRHIVVLSSSGNLAYEDWLKLDDAGLIVGNDRSFETVSKLQFTNTAERPHRALAIRSHGDAILHAFPLFSTEYSDFVPCDTYEVDRFNILTFDDASDHLTVERKFRAITASERSTFSALMRGTDHPHFIGDRYPKIEGDSVIIDLGKGPIWSVTARLEGFGTVTVDCPRNERIEFSAKVSSVTMTDALDNDWTTYAWGPQ